MMTAARMARAMTQLWQRGIRGSHGLNQRTYGWLGVLAGGARETMKPDSSITVEALAYFSLLALFPIILLSISIASFNTGLLLDQRLIIHELEFIAPALSQILGQNIDEIIQARGPITGVAITGLIWSASSVFYMLTRTLNKIWAIKRSRPIWKRRGLAILFVLTLAGPVLILASFASRMIANLRTWLPDQIVPIGDGISFAVAILLNVTLFFCLHLHLYLKPGLWFSGGEAIETLLRLSPSILRS